MLQKISDLSLRSYLAITGLFRGLGRDERGLSGVVVAILLILVAVLAILLIWGFLGDWLKATWERITEQGDAIK